MNKNISKLLIGASVGLSLTACSTDSFLDRVPNNALSRETAWQTPGDAEQFLVGAYRDWESMWGVVYPDCGSDFGFNYHRHEGYRTVGDGSMTAASPGVDLYDFTTVRRANELLVNIDKIPFAEADQKKSIIAQARFLRAYNYFKVLWSYGVCPILENYNSAAEAQVAPKGETEMIAFLNAELDAIEQDLPDRPRRRGEVARGAALALKMRMNLYYGNYELANDAATKIIASDVYSLDDSYSNLFDEAQNTQSPEVILAVQYLPTVRQNYYPAIMRNNKEGGWSSVVPTQNLIDTYEMKNGYPISDPASGYDPTMPFKDRDPRMAMTVLFPGADYSGGIFNTLDAKIGTEDNANYPIAADNSSKTALTWRKYAHPQTEYKDPWNTGASGIVFRYAEVLLSSCEAINEMRGPTPSVYSMLNLVRERVGMPWVDQSRYTTKEALRELIRRERAVELAGEGLRRADILRWKDNAGQPLAMTVLNGPLNRIVGTVDMNTSTPEGERAKVNVSAPASERLVENRIFQPHMRYLPIPVKAIDRNPKLKQNPGY